MNGTLLTIMMSSVAFQFVAAFMAIRMIRLSGAFAAWIFLACGFVFQGVRRIVALFHLLDGTYQGDLTVELLGLLISMLITVGIWKFKPLFEDINRNHQALVNYQSEIMEVNRNLEEEVAERSRFEKQLQDSENLFRTVADFTYDWEYWIAPDGSFRYISPSCLEITGYSAEEFRVDPGLLFRIVHPDDSALFGSHREQIDANGHPVPIDFRIISLDGQVHWIAHRCRHVFDRRGSFLGWRASNREINDRKNIEKELHNTIKLLQKTFESLNESIFIVQTGSRIILDCNRAVEKMFGYTRDEMVGASTSCLHESEQKSQQFGREMLAAYDEKGWFETFFRMRRKDGSIFHSEHFVSPIRNESGEVVSHVCVVRDISVRIEAEEQQKAFNAELELRVRQRTEELERLNRELESFCYSISHELRAPIARLEGFSRAISEAAAGCGSDELPHLAERVEVSSRRLRGVIDALLRMNRLSRDTMQIEAVDMSELCRKCITTIFEGAGEPRPVVTIAADVVVQGDRRMLGICMHNLLDNAVKYSSRTSDARIEFGQELRPDGTVYYVRDNGAGFEMAYAEKLFEPFCRLHSQSEFIGDGIGLATVHRVIERHGGKIWAESEPDRGATFFFTLGSGGG